VKSIARPYPFGALTFAVALAGYAGTPALEAAPRSHVPPSPRYAIEVIPVEVGPAWPGYLPQVGAPPLRWEPPPATPAPATALPPIAAALIHLHRGQPVPVARDFEPPPPEEAPVEATPAEPPGPPPPPPPPRPEDFLPYFEHDPLANPRPRRPHPGDRFHFVPALSEPLPRSEALYEQR
jgi:hypothetical protein